MSRRGVLDQVAFWEVVAWLRLHPDGKVTDSDQAELKSLSGVAAWLAGQANPEVSLVKKVDAAVTWMSQETERLERAWERTDIAGMPKTLFIVLETLFRIGSYQQTMRVLASTRYVAVLVPFSHVTVSTASKALAERGHFTLYTGNSTIPWRRSSQDSSNVYELNSNPPAGENPAFPEALRPLEEFERLDLEKFVSTSSRRKRTLTPAREFQPAPDLPMTLDELMAFGSTPKEKGTPDAPPGGLSPGLGF